MRESSVVKEALLGQGVSGNGVAVLVIFLDLAAVYKVDSTCENPVIQYASLKTQRNRF